MTRRGPASPRMCRSPSRPPPTRRRPDGRPSPAPASPPACGPTAPLRLSPTAPSATGRPLTATCCGASWTTLACTTTSRVSSRASSAASARRPAQPHASPSTRRARPPAAPSTATRRCSRTTASGTASTATPARAAARAATRSPCINQIIRGIQVERATASSTSRCSRQWGEQFYEKGMGGTPQVFFGDISEMCGAKWRDFVAHRDELREELGLGNMYPTQQAAGEVADDHGHDRLSRAAGVDRRLGR